MMVATLLEPDLAAVASAIRLFDPHTEAFEVRFDAFTRFPEPAEIRKLTPKPLIAACRRKTDGGQWKGDEHERLAILERAFQAGFDHVDLEGPTNLAVPEERVIRSFHDTRKTPDLPELLRLAQDLSRGGAHAKIATHARNLGDTLNLLEAQRRTARANGGASLMGMGDFPRAVAHVVGCRLIYGGARSNAPGQPALRDTRAVLEHWGNPSPSPNVYLILGSPIAHSLSPRIHNAAFRAQGVDAAYAGLELGTGKDLDALLARADALGVRGASVTAPLKEWAYERADSRTPQAQRARSTNCLKWEDGKMVAHNTDGLGAQRVLDLLLDGRAQKPRVLLIGTGGAARGFLAQVEGHEFVVAGRTLPKMRAIENEFGVGTVPIERASHYLGSYDAIVNATSVEDPLNVADYRGALFDLHYGDQPTAWERAAKSNGLRFAGGRSLVLEQALPAYEFWTGRAAPRAAMETAAGGAP